MQLKRLAWGALFLLIPAAASAGEGKYSALVWADAYYMAANHDSTLENSSGFWFRRIYLTYDYKTDDAFSARVRLEAASPGDFSTRSTMTTFLKDAYLKWEKGAHAVFAGLSPTPTLALLEDFWGYRSLERVPDDLHRLGGSRDIGLAATGTVDGAKRFGYYVMAANGSGTESETNKGKKGMASIRIAPTEKIVLEAYGDYEDRTNDADRKTFHAFAGYKVAKFRAGVEYAKQIRNTVGEDVKLEIISGFVTGAVTDKVWLVGRVDRSTEPNPEGGKITYLPFASTSASTFVLGAVDFRVRDNISIMPNVEAITYDAPDGGGATPGSDIMGRLTFAWTM